MNIILWNLNSPEWYSPWFITVRKAISNTTISLENFENSWLSFPLNLTSKGYCCILCSQKFIYSILLLFPVNKHVKLFLCLFSWIVRTLDFIYSYGETFYLLLQMINLCIIIVVSVRNNITEIDVHIRNIDPR